MTSLNENLTNQLHLPPPVGAARRAAGLMLGLRRTNLLAAAGIAIVVFGFLAMVQFASPSLVGTDGYYHIKLAAIMRDQGLKIDFPWLPLTILNARDYYDHHLLFHAALVPFTFDDLRLGAKWASVLFGGLACLSVWWLLQRQRVPLAGMWALGLLAISEGFIYRMSMPRAQSLSLVVLVIGLQWLIAGKTWQLALLGFTYVWLYDAFPLLFVLAGLYSASIWLTERRLELRPLLFAGLGIGLGLLVNPYFPENLAFITRHLLPKLYAPGEVRVGNEWYPYTTSQLLENSPLALAAFAAGILGLGLQERRLEARTASAFLASLFFGVMLLQSRRFIEYFPPFALIFAALAWAPILQEHPVEGRAPSGQKPHGAGKWLTPQRAGGLVLALLLAPGLWITGRGAAEAVSESPPYQRYQRAAAWLANSTPPGSLVFQTDWDDFTRLFYNNTHNTYLAGLDPTFLELANPNLYEAWVAISQGKVSQPSAAIFEQFGARYAMTDLSHRDFIDQAARDPGMREVFRDPEAIIYAVVLNNR